MIRIGTISGRDARIWSVVTKVAAREGLNVKVIEFDDYARPNAARAQDRNPLWMKKRVAAYESDELRKSIDTQFNSVIIPAL